jgi:hypothetical protein
VSRRTDELERRVKKANETLEHLIGAWAGKGTPSVLFEFMRRGEQPFGADGYATRSALDPSGVGGGSSDMTSVESAANARMADKCSRCEGTGKYGGRAKCRACNGSGRRWADPVSEDVTEALKQLGVALRALDTVASRVDSVMGTAAKFAGRQSTLQGTCAVEACSAQVSGIGSDRLRGGFCNRCSLHHGSWKLLHPPSGDPGADRLAFVGYMTDWLAQKAQRDRERAERESREIERLRRRGELPAARIARK